LNIFRQFYYSLFNTHKIAEFRHQTIGKTILFIFFLSFLIFIPQMMLATSEINQTKNEIEHHLSIEENQFAIENGQLQMNKDQPFTTTFLSELVLFDSTGEVEPGDVKNIYNAQFAFLKDRMVMANVITNNFIEITYGDTNWSNLSKGDILQFINTFLTLILITIWISSYFILLLITFFTIFMLAILGTLVAQTTARAVQFSGVWKMAVYSLSLAVLFFFIMDSLKVSVAFRDAITFFVSLTMLVSAIIKVPKKNANDDISF